MTKRRSSHPNQPRTEAPATPQTRVPFRASLAPGPRPPEAEDDSGLHELFPVFAEASDLSRGENKTDLAEVSRRLRKLAERARHFRSAERITQSKRTTKSAPSALQYENLLAQEPALLAQLAEQSSGRTASRLHAFQAERASAEHVSERVVKHLEFARDADDTDPWVQFSLRIHALHSQHWDRARDRLNDEIEVTQGLVHQHALLWRATLGLAGHEDFHRAHAAAEEASERPQAGPLASILSAEFHKRAGNTELEHAMLEASIARSRESKALLRERLAGALETSDGVRALRLYLQLIDDHPRPQDVHCAAARVALHCSDLVQAKRQLALAGETSEDSELREAFVRAAVITGLLVDDKQPPALANLESSRETIHRATRACALLDAEEPTKAALAAETFAQRATGTDLIYSTALLLEAAIASQDRPALVRAARKAIALAELTPWVQALSTKYEALAWAQEGGAIVGPDALADALFSPDGNGTAESELSLLQAPTTLVEHVLALDVCAELQSEHLLEAMTALRNALHAGSRLGSSLVLAGLLTQNGQTDRAVIILKETFRETKHHPLVGYQLARLQRTSDPMACADTLLATLDHARDAWASSIAMRAGQIIAEAGGNPTQAYRLALDEHPAHFPAIWELERIAREAEDVSTCAQLHRHAARQTSSPVIAGLHLVQAALLLHELDTVSASQCIEEAAVLFPEDAAIAEMLLRLSSQSSGAARALALEALASVSEGSWAASATFRAGLEWEHAKHAKNALAMFEELPADHSSIIVRRAHDRIETALGLPQGVAERLFEDAKRAHQPNARISMLERLAHTDAWLCEDEGSAAMSMQAILEVAGWHVPALRFLQRYYARHGRVQELSEITEMLQAVSESNSHARLHASLQTHSGRPVRKAADGAQTRWQAERQRSGEALERLVQLSSDPTETAALQHIIVSLRLNSTPMGELLHRLSEAEKAWPAHPLVPETRARIHEAAGEYVEAARAFERAAERAASESRRVSLRSRAGQIWLEDAADPIRAQRCFEAVLNERMRPEALRGLINALSMSRQDGELLARLELEASLPHDPSDLAWILERLADRYRATENARRELATLERLCWVDSESADAWLKWARALAKSGQTQEAREPYEHAISLIEDEQAEGAADRRVDALLEYATFLFRGAKNRAAARETLKEAMQLEPDNERAALLASELGSSPGLISLLPPASLEPGAEPLPEAVEEFLTSGSTDALSKFSKWLQTRHEWELARNAEAVLGLATGKSLRMRVRAAGPAALQHADRLFDSDFQREPLVRFVQMLGPVFDATLKRSHTARKAHRLLPDADRKVAHQRVSSAFGEPIGVRGHSRRDTFCVPMSSSPPFLVVSDSLLAYYDADSWEHALTWGAVILRLRLHPLSHTDTAHLCAELRTWAQALVQPERGGSQKKERRALEALVSRQQIEDLRATVQTLGSIDEAQLGRLRRKLVETTHRVALLTTGCIGAAVDVAAFDGLRGPDRRTELWVEQPLVRSLLRFILSRDFHAQRQTLL